MKEHEGRVIYCPICKEPILTVKEGKLFVNTSHEGRCFERGDEFQAKIDELRRPLYRAKKG